MDSLSIYKEIDIASAKPSQQDLSSVHHFGIDITQVDSHFNVADFFDIYIDAAKQAKVDGKNLVIVGGSGFYLKMLLDGLSPSVDISAKSVQKSHLKMTDLSDAYRLIKEHDPTYARKISSNDVYRIEKWLSLFYEVGMNTTEYFTIHKPEKIIEHIDIYEIDVSREVLAQRIAIRTKKMLNMGLIDEVCMLEKKYTRVPNPMKSIGIKEVCDFLDGKYTIRAMQEAIEANTRKLAKRQQIFNKSQFMTRHHLVVKEILKDVNNSF